MSRILLSLLFLLFVSLPRRARAEEPSIVANSTVIGRNYGYILGQPSQGPTPVGEISLAIEIDVFLKNLELSGLPEDGQTFIGFLVPIRARFRADERLTIELGAILGQDFGDNTELNNTDPLVRLVFEPVESVFILAGTILPTHWIHDALHDDVQKFRTGAEQGIQVRVDRERFKEDFWLNWRVRENSITAEEFEVGNATQFRLDEGKIQIDLQVMLSHVGGQRNNANRVENNFVYLAGASYGIPNPFRRVDEIRFGGRVMLSHDERRGFETTNGSGVELFVVSDIHVREDILVHLYGSYFKGDDLLARRGDPLYNLDEYSQIGFAAIFSRTKDMRIELGALAQITDGKLNYGFKITFTWGHVFKLATAK